MLKDGKAKRTQVALSLSKKASRVILLSGTPALSRPAELFSQIRLVNDRLFPNFHEFALRYCDGKQGRFCFEAKGCTNSEELTAILLKRVMIRRLKSQVLRDLPDKRREVVYLSGDKIDSRMNSLQEAKKAFERNSGMQTKDGKGVNDSLLEYFSLTGIVKAAAVCSHILDNYFYPDAPKKKVLIFAHHQIVLDTVQVEVQKRNLKSVRIDGQTSSKDRGNLCQAFQEDPDVEVAILSMTAAGVGITLTAASVVVFAELHWNPGTLLQAEDRAHRVGQKDSVFVQYLIARNTADDFIWPLVQKKLDVLGQVSLSNDTFRDAERSHLRCETHHSEITDFFNTDENLASAAKRARIEN
ncbi:helicase protein [Ancylostoma duodenale]|uniref:Helicase protein n=1 Tax=Ancylostoma duodenale TaxID=51022 RepID=A0A0C2CN89_9BILA|nr:helicase protein [Ancylostoma duodenale]